MINKGKFMTDEYQNAVKKLVEYVGDTVNFAKEQMPDVAREILVYNAAIDHYWLALFVITAVAGFFTFTIGLLTDGEGKQACGGIMVVTGILFSVSTYCDLVKIETAPKLYILDELNSKLKRAEK